MSSWKLLKVRASCCCCRSRPIPSEKDAVCNWMNFHNHQTRFADSKTRPIHIERGSWGRQVVVGRKMDILPFSLQRWLGLAENLNISRNVHRVDGFARFSISRGSLVLLLLCPGHGHLLDHPQQIIPSPTECHSHSLTHPHTHTPNVPPTVVNTRLCRY